MNSMLKKDIEALCSYICETEYDDYFSRLIHGDEPGLSREEADSLEGMNRYTVEASKLVEKAAVADEDGMHVYACAVRIMKEVEAIGV